MQAPTKLLSKAALWAVGAIGAAVVVLMMLYYRDSSQQLEKDLQRVTNELVATEDRLDKALTDNALIMAQVASGEKAKADSRSKTDESIKALGDSGRSSPLDGNTIRVLQQRSSEVRKAASERTGAPSNPGSP